MSRYVRTTEDCIYDTENLHYRWIENNKVYKVGWDVEKPTFEADIIKEADTIEELCDCFVAVRKNASGTYSVFFIELEEKEKWIDSYTIYGAIWTEWGLKYVAKMNDKGELELI